MTTAILEREQIDIVAGYTAVPGSPFTNQDAQIIGPELNRLAESGASTIPDIVEAAKNPKSPFRPYFTWDTNRAAEERWEDQARHMVRSIMVQVRDVKGKIHTTRAFLPIRIVMRDARGPAGSAETMRPMERAPEARPATSERKQFLPIKLILGDPEYRQQPIQAAYRQLVSWRKINAIYRDVFGDVFDAIDSLQIPLEGMG